MRMRLAPFLVVAVVLAASARATTLKPMTLAGMAEVAECVFVGTVAGTTTVAGGAPYDLLYTEVTFDDLTAFGGEIPGVTVRYRFAGGRLGSRRQVVPGMPGFFPGERIVMFASRDGLLSDAVGFSQGVFWIDARTGIVRDAAGRPVAGIEEFLDEVRALFADAGDPTVGPEEDR